MWIEASTTSTIGYGAWHGNPLPAGKDTPNAQPLAPRCQRGYKTQKPPNALSRLAASRASATSSPGKPNRIIPGRTLARDHLLVKGVEPASELLVDLEQ